MVVKKQSRPRKQPAALAGNWQAAIQKHLAQVPDVDAVFVCAENNTVHVYSVVYEFDESFYKRLMKKERLVETACPDTSFEFHTRAHQGREPHYAVPYDAEQVFLR